MEDLEDSEIQFSEWTESRDFELMDTEDGLIEEKAKEQDSLTTSTILVQEHRAEG
jgi:hypothetical protein